MSKAQLKTEHDLERYWKIISEDGMDPEAYAEAMQWLNAHSTDIKQLDNLISSSERKARRHKDFTSLEDADRIRTLSYDPEAVLPAEVRHLLYDDMRWFNRAAYMPKNSDEDNLLYLDKKIVEGLHELTEQQRECCSALSSTANPQSR